MAKNQLGDSGTADEGALGHWWKAAEQLYKIAASTEV